MKLDRVTITGADAYTDPEDLMALSQEYGFVEWGILFSSRREGTTRYPPRPWLLELDKVVERSQRKPLLSAHLCGRYMRDFVRDGNIVWWREYGFLARWFNRVQLNMGGYTPADAWENLDLFLASFEPKQDIIIQVHDNDQWAKPLCQERGTFPLFDASGGQGIMPATWEAPWPASPTRLASISPRIYTGYAGGIAPDTIHEALTKLDQIVPVTARIWIDMEQGVRTGDYLNLDKVRTVLDACARHVWNTSMGIINDPSIWMDKPEDNEGDDSE